MRKNGFTLIEISVVVFFLSVLTLFIVPRVSSIIDNNKSKVCDSIIVSIEEAAKNYTYLNTSIVDNGISTNTYFDVTLLDLKKEGLLEIDLVNPYNNNEIPDTNKVRITKDRMQYVYTYMGDECK